MARPKPGVKKYFTAKQRRAFNRSIDRSGESPLRKGECRRVNNRGVVVCRNAKGLFVGNHAVRRY